MTMNILIVAVWVIAIVLFDVGYFVKDRIEERKNEKENERLWS